MRLQPRYLCAPACLAVVFRVCFLGSPEPVAHASARPKAGSVERSIAKTPATVVRKAKAKESDTMPALPAEFLAFDVSRPFGPRRVSFDSELWTEFCKASLLTGRRMVVVQARGSSTSNAYADLLLKTAREEGLRTAAYVFLNFRRSAPSGADQLKLALRAAGSEAKFLDFMVVDVEGGSAGDMTTAERVNRIGQAVEAVTKSNLRPVIYAKNTGGLRGEWTDLTGNATDFSYLPLWVPRYDSRATLQFDGFGEVAWKSFGGWSVRHGKQFADNTSTAAPYGLPADENIFSRSLLSGPKEARPYKVNGLVNVVAGRARRDKRTGEVVQPVRIVNRSSSAILGPLSVVLNELTSHSPLINGHGKAQSGKPFVRISSKTLKPGGYVLTQLRFARTTSGPPSYHPEVHAGTGEV
jgi:hypothetical protein